MSPKQGLVNPAEFVTGLSVAKQMMFVAAKTRNCTAYWSKERKRWLLINKEPLQLDLESFCGPYGQVKKLRNRECDYAAVQRLLSK